MVKSSISVSGLELECFHFMSSSLPTIHCEHKEVEILILDSNVFRVITD